MSGKSGIEISGKVLREETEEWIRRRMSGGSVEEQKRSFMRQKLKERMNMQSETRDDGKGG